MAKKVKKLIKIKTVRTMLKLIDWSCKGSFDRPTPFDTIP